ncbi:S53 family peptidase, partial [Clostridium paridis]
KKKSLLVLLIITIISLCVFFFEKNSSSVDLNDTNKNTAIETSSNDPIKGYTPNQIRYAYGIDKLDLYGENQKIAVIVPYGSPTIENDVSIFNKQFNLPDLALKISYPCGEPDKIDMNWAAETSLDVQWTHALAPKATISLIISKTDSIDDLLKCIDYAVSNNEHIISMSWGFNEFQNELSYEKYFDNKNITFIASSGDGGPQVNWPAVSPNVLAVGGTTLTLNKDSNITEKEGLWSNSGGGISKYINAPKYQGNLNVGAAKNYRSVPDVSFFADSSVGVAVYCSTKYNPHISGWTNLAGTSLGPPAWAAFTSLVNEKLGYPIGNINEILYNLATDKNQYTTNFRDITNSTDNIGYDLSTGIGSPIENMLFKYLTNK